jgi:peptidoglycan/xylan/chitin deacetylase (PgdA/CDA1 family)
MACRPGQAVVSDVALTFDDGPSIWTERLLEVLRDHGARATFFVVGASAADQPELLRRMRDEGHELGNHTWSHPSLTRDCDDEQVRDELARTNDLLAEALGSAPSRFRAPHFDVDDRVESIGRELGLRHTPANVNPPDWHPNWAAKLTIAMVANQTQAGSILCLHDGIPPNDADGDRQATVDAVQAFLPRLAERDLRCVTATELLG